VVACLNNSPLLLLAEEDRTTEAAKKHGLEVATRKLGTVTDKERKKERKSKKARRDRHFRLFTHHSKKREAAFPFGSKIR
jgi:hypothetical protein